MSGPPLSIEAVVLGRNDEYEPNWQQKLFASIAYNRARFEGSAVDYRVAFVEWNPPRDRPLIAPELVSKFPFLRAITVDADVHDALCTSRSLAMMLNFSLNCALRTSTSDFCLISAGDLFLQDALAGAIKKNGLARNCLYRAERVNIRDDLDFASATKEVIEDPANIVSVNSCTEPPYDRAPYTHACGDFLLVDRLTMAGLRGFDEGIRFARMHLDSRFCRTAMYAGLDCKLIGRIFHINHTKSYTVLGEKYPDQQYDYELGLPYLNSRDWGLADYDWTQTGERLWRVSCLQGFKEGGIPEQFTRAERQVVNEVTSRVFAAREAEVLGERDENVVQLKDVGLSGLFVDDSWKGARVIAGSPPLIETVKDAWGYSAAVRLPQVAAIAKNGDGAIFLEVVVQVSVGTVGVGLVQNGEFAAERIQDEAMGVRRIVLKMPQGDVWLLVRNAQTNGTASRVNIHRIRLLRRSGPSQSIERLLMPIDS